MGGECFREGKSRSLQSSIQYLSECGKTRRSLCGWKSGLVSTTRTNPPRRSFIKSTIRISSSTSSTTTSPRRIASSNCSKKSSENEMEREKPVSSSSSLSSSSSSSSSFNCSKKSSENEMERDNPSQSHYRIVRYLFLCTRYLIHILPLP